MSAVVLQGAACLALFMLVTWAVFNLPGGSRAPGPVVRRVRRWSARLLPGRRNRGLAAVPVPTARPLEDIVHDARRLSARVHEPPRGTSFAKHLAACSVYDRVLGEACAALGVEHLLGVLPPGEELDAERTRIETALWLAGLRFEDAA